MTVVVPLSAFFEIDFAVFSRSPKYCLKECGKLLKLVQVLFLPSNLQGQPSLGSKIAMWI